MTIATSASGSAAIDTFVLTITSVDGDIFNRSVRSLVLESTEGQLTLLPRHAEFLCSLRPCVMKITCDDYEVIEYPIKEGYAHFLDNACSVLKFDELYGSIS